MIVVHDIPFSEIESKVARVLLVSDSEKSMHEKINQYQYESRNAE